MTVVQNDRYSNWPFSVIIELNVFWVHFTAYWVINMCAAVQLFSNESRIYRTKRLKIALARSSIWLQSSWKATHSSFKWKNWHLSQRTSFISVATVIQRYKSQHLSDHLSYGRFRSYFCYSTLQHHMIWTIFYGPYCMEVVNSAFISTKNNGIYSS